MSEYAQPEVLVSTDWVKENLGKPGIKLVEIDVDTKAYDAGHIPGAVGFNWQTQLQDQVARDIIGKEGFEKLVGAAGISPSDTVILYGDNNNWFAAYGFWLFKVYGHKDVRLMNGGRQKWLNEADKDMNAERPRRHVQIGGRPQEDLPGAAGRRSQKGDDRLLPHRRAVEPHLVRAKIPLGPGQREELRRQLDGVRQPGRRPDREMTRGRDRTR